MNSSSLAPFTGLLAGLPAALGGAPWWAVGATVITAYLAVPLTSLILEHARQRKGTHLDEKFAATLDQITDPEKRIQAIISYRQATTPAPQPPPDPPPGALPPTAPDSGSQPPATA
ncbi:hypothetical protein GCM10009548_86560 [Streptomyces malaysiensis subsp. malaysiensis]